METTGESLLSTICKNQDWFHSVSKDEFNRLIVYTKYMSLQVYEFVPEELSGSKVLIHFEQSVNSKRENYTEYLGRKLSDNLSIDYLLSELDRLERTCGVSALEAIFYEIHDGVNAVTDFSLKYPEVRSSLEKLYETFGFDTIYNEMEC